MSKLEGFEVTGEFRLPRGGDWYVEPPTGTPYQSQGDFVDTPLADPHGYGWRRVILKRTAPGMVAVMLPRGVAVREAKGRDMWEEGSPRRQVGDAAAEALARTAVLIAGPAGCAEVSVEDAQRHTTALQLWPMTTPPTEMDKRRDRLVAAFRKAAGGS